VGLRSKLCFFSHSLAGIVGSDSAIGLDVCLLLSGVSCTGRGVYDGPIPHPEES
jgi:hypothetical protein